MASLTHLNELSVLVNLKERYLSNLIYVSSFFFFCRLLSMTLSSGEINSMT